MIEQCEQRLDKGRLIQLQLSDRLADGQLGGLVVLGFENVQKGLGAFAGGRLKDDRGGFQTTLRIVLAGEAENQF